MIWKRYYAVQVSIGRFGGQLPRGLSVLATTGGRQIVPVY